MSCIISSVIYVNPIACVCAEHPLARHCDILTAIETRISLLGMTFMKYVDLDLCCFIPGKVIDEIFTVLRTIQAERNPPRAYEVLQVVPATSHLRYLTSGCGVYFGRVRRQKIREKSKFGGKKSVKVWSAFLNSAVLISNLKVAP
jgi:hypothetical protein